MDVSVLEKMGLSKAEVKVYLTLLSLGPSPSNKIVRETDLRKSTVYDSIRRLQEKGLVSYVIKDSKKYFEATEPSRLVEFVHDKKRELDEYEEGIKDLVSSIEKSYGPPRPEAEAHILSGVEGFKTMNRDIIKHADGELLLLGAIIRVFKVMPAFFESWNNTRIRDGIRLRILLKRSVEDNRKLLKRNLVGNFEARVLPKEIENPAVINIYGDRTVNVLWKGDYPLCFMMINKEMAEAYKQYFNYLWGKSRPLGH